MRLNTRRDRQRAKCMKTNIIVRTLWQVWVQSFLSDALLRKEACLFIVACSFLLPQAWIWSETIPQAQRFIGSSGNDCAAVWWHRHLQDALRVTSKIGLLLHRRILPHRQLIVCKPMGRDEFSVVLREEQRADLRLRIDWVCAASVANIPELDATVSCSTSGCENVWLPRAPCECTNSCLMFIQDMNWAASSANRARFRCPNVDDVVIAAARQVLQVRRPFESTNFLCVTWKCSNEMFTLTNVVVDDGSVSRTRRHHVGVPCQGSDPCTMAWHHTQAFHFAAVPQLNISTVGADRENVSFFYPREWTSVITVFVFEQYFYVASRSIPQVNWRAKSNCNDVVRTPVEKVQVVVVNDVRSIQDSFWICWNEAWTAFSRHGSFGRVNNTQRIHMRFRSSWCLCLICKDSLLADVHAVKCFRKCTTFVIWRFLDIVWCFVAVLIWFFLLLFLLDLKLNKKTKNKDPAGHKRRSNQGSSLSSSLGWSKLTK